MILRVLWVEQIPDGLNIDLVTTHRHAESLVAKLLTLLEMIKDHMYCSRNDSDLGTFVDPLHRIGFARTSLAIGENADVVPVECAFHHTLYLLENAILVDVLSKDFVKSECVACCLTVRQLLE